MSPSLVVLVGLHLPHVLLIAERRQKDQIQASRKCCYQHEQRALAWIQLFQFSLYSYFIYPLTVRRNKSVNKLVHLSISTFPGLRLPFKSLDFILMLKLHRRDVCNGIKPCLVSNHFLTDDVCTALKERSPCVGALISLNIPSVAGPLRHPVGSLSSSA